MYLKILEKIKPGKVIQIILLVGFVLLAIYAIEHFDFDFTRNFIEEHRILGIFLVLAIYAGLGATPIPSEPITVFLTGLGGPTWTVFCVTIGNTIASFIEYFIGHRVGDVSGFEKRKKTLPFNLNKMPVEAVPFQLLGRMIPGIGAKSVGVLSGIYRVNLFRFFWTSIVSNLAGAMLIVLSSMGIFHLV